MKTRCACCRHYSAPRCSGADCQTCEDCGQETSRTSPGALDAERLLNLPEVERLRYMLGALRGCALAVLNRPASDRRRADAMIALARMVEATSEVDDAPGVRG